MSSATIPIAVLLVVASAGLVSGHPDTGGDPASPADHAFCTGNHDWRNDGFVLTQTIGAMDEELILYIHVPPHGPPASQDPGPGPGIIWMEENGFDGFQKGDFFCDPDGPGGDPATFHGDTVVF